MDQPTLHILGCGRAARSLARRFHRCGAMQIGQVVNRTLDSGRKAAAFIGAGTPATELDAGIEHGWLMLGLPDGLIGDVANKLSGQLESWPALAFHLSGSVSSGALVDLGVPVAAVHPLRAFADPALAAENFEGTWCVAEGDQAALAMLRPIFEHAGGRWKNFDPDNKAAWHAATVAASNFLVAVNALARELAHGAGMNEHDAARLLADLQQGTLANLGERPATEALTGPIERGDHDACRRLHEAAHASLAPDRARVFDALALATLDLAVEKRGKRDCDAGLKELFSG